MVRPADSWIPGYRFKDGRLLVFESDRITLVRAWPDPDAAQKVGDRPWRPLHPRFRLVRPYRRRPAKQAAATRQGLLPLALPPAPPTRAELAAQKRRAFDSLRFSLPRELARAIERFRCGQFALLRAQGASPRFVELLLANPTLAFFVANASGCDGARCAAGELVTLKQPAIAERLGLPPTPAAVRTLRKIAPESVTPDSVELVREALRAEAAQRRLSHLPRINAGVLRLVGDERLRAVTAPTLLDEVAQDGREKYRAVTADLVLDVLALEEELHGRVRPPKFASVRRLQEVHHRLREEYVATRARGILECRFPPPPLPGTADIVPLVHPRDLITEGLWQHNCVASYAPAVAGGDTFIYRVLRPERATLAVRRTGGSGWYCSELLAACNQPVRRATRSAVERWIEERTVSA